MESSVSLKAFLRDRRRRVRREDLGLPAHRTGRQAGLGRDDVAELLNVSSPWYALFESGTSKRRFSAPFLNRLADVLQLDELDRDLFFRLVTASGAAARDAEFRWNERRSLESISTVAETSRQLATAPDLSSAIALASERLLAFFRSAAADVVLLLDRGIDVELLHYADGVQSRSVVVEKAFAAICFQGMLPIGDALIIADIRSEAALNRAFDALEMCIGENDGSARSVIVLPVTAAERHLGALCIISPFLNAFTYLEAEIARAIAAQLGRALDANDRGRTVALEVV